jgi:hypothetical protein
MRNVAVTGSELDDVVDRIRAPGESAAEPLSPELVLVAPELAALARASLPDRPWELYLPSPVRAVRSPRHGDSVSAPRARPRARGARASRRAVLRTAAVVTVLFGVLAATAVAPPRNAPTLAADTTNARGSAASHTAAVIRNPPVTASPQSSAATTRPAPHAAHTSGLTRSRPSNARGAASKNPQRATGPAAKPKATHVPASPRFVLDSRRHLIVRYAATLRCAGRVVLTNIPVAADGTFSASHRFWGSRGEQVIVWLEGRVHRRSVRGKVRVRRSPCATRTVSFAVRPRIT